MNDRELLKAIYGSIDWRDLYKSHPDVKRAEVDDLFARLAPTLIGASKPADAPVEGLILYTDGGSSGNPGPAGTGMALCLPDGTELEAWGSFIGRATNNVAEYRAMIAGLERAIELQAGAIEIRSDSELMVKQIKGQYKVKNAALAGLHAQALELLKRFGGWTIRHIPRERNKRADALARSAIKKGKGRSREPR